MDTKIRDRIFTADLANIVRKVQAGKTLTASERKAVALAAGESPPPKAVALPKLGVAVSLSAAAALLGISRAAVQAAKAAGCRAIRQNGRVDCDDLWTWLDEHPEILESAGDKVDRSIEITLKIRAERLLREHQLAVQRSEYVPAEQVERDTVDLIATAKSVLLSGPASLAPQVVGVSIPEAELILREWLHTALSKLHADPLGRRAGTTQ